MCVFEGACMYVIIHRFRDCVEMRICKRRVYTVARGTKRRLDHYISAPWVCPEHWNPSTRQPFDNVRSVFGPIDYFSALSPRCAVVEINQTSDSEFYVYVWFLFVAIWTTLIMQKLCLNGFSVVVWWLSHWAPAYYKRDRKNNDDITA